MSGLSQLASWPQVLALVLLVGWLAVSVFNKYIKAKPAAPTIRHDPVKAWYGSINELGKAMTEHGSLLPLTEKQYKQYGGISQLVLPLGLSMILVDDPAALKEIHQTLTPDKLDRDHIIIGQALCAIMPTGQTGLRTNETHRAHRKALAPALSKTALTGMGAHMGNAANELVELFEVKRKLSEGRPWNALQDVTVSMTDAATSYLFGQGTGDVRSAIDTLKRRNAKTIGTNADGGSTGLDVEGGRLFHSLQEMNTSLARIADRSVGHGWLYDLLFDRWLPKRRQAMQFSRSYLAKQINKARGQPLKRADSVLTVLAEQSPSARLSVAEEIDELLGMMISAQATVPFTLSWGLKLLARNPEVQRRLHEHLPKNLPNLFSKPLGADHLDIDKVPYLEAVVHEILRLSRTNPGGSRRVNQDVVLMGHAIPKGSFILTSHAHSYLETAPPGYDARQDAEARRSRGCGYWTTDPSLFQPERWLDADGKFDSKAGPFPVFGGNSIRACWGKSIALLELKTYVAVLCSQFFFADVGKLDNNEAFTCISISPKSAWVKPVPWSEVE